MICRGSSETSYKNKKSAIYSMMDDNTASMIIDQSPDGTTKENVAELYDKHNGNVADILADLWDINKIEKEANNISIEEMQRKNKFAEIRDICNSFDEEMEKYLHNIRQKQ